MARTTFEEMERARIVSVQDITDTIEEIEDDESEDIHPWHTLLEEVRAGDFKWRGEWYADHLISEHFFARYAEELADECGMVPEDAKWPLTHIDWDAAAEELKMDYSTVEIGETTFYFRA